MDLAEVVRGRSAVPGAGGEELILSCDCTSNWRYPVKRTYLFFPGNWTCVVWIRLRVAKGRAPAHEELDTRAKPGTSRQPSEQKKDGYTWNRAYV